MSSTILNLSARSPIDGTEAYVLATSGANWKAVGNANIFVFQGVAGGNAASSSLTLESTTGTGSTDAIIVKTGSQSECLRWSSNGQIVLNNGGLTTLGTNAFIVLNCVDGTNNPSALHMDQWSAYGNELYTIFEKSRGATIGTHTVLNQNDFVGSVYFAPSTGSAFALSGAIRGFVDAATTSGNRVPIALLFYTTINGGSLTERVRIDNSGNHITKFGNADQSYSFQTPTTGFSITIGNNVWHLVLDPSATLATGTITMPSSPVDGQLVNIRSSQIVTTLTVSPNTGQSIKNAPTTISAGGTLDAIFRTANTTWYF